MIKEQLRREGQRIEAFALDIWDGREWREIAKGTTVGYKKLLRFPAVETTKTRVRIIRARDWVSPLDPRESFGLFLDPGR
jgi:alpha-L-fucosidase